MSRVERRPGALIKRRGHRVMIFQDASVDGRSHIRMVLGHPSDLTLLVSVRRTGSPGLSVSIEESIHLKHLLSFEDVVSGSGQFMS